jgi:hypothetical protein
MKRFLLLISIFSFLIICVVRLHSSSEDKNSILDQIEGAANLKQSLREIASLSGDASDSFSSKSTDKGLTDKDFSELGNLLSLAPSLHSKASADSSSNLASNGMPRSRSDAALDGLGSNKCGKACLDALSSRMLATTNKPGSALHQSFASTSGDNTVGAERERREERKERTAAERSKFIAAERRRMNEAIARGWKDLKNDLHQQAKSELKSALYFHRSLLHLLQGSSELNRNLQTPKSIKSLQNALYSSPPEHQPVPKELKNIMANIPDQEDKTGADPNRRSEHYDRTPRKLEAILSRNFHDLDDLSNKRRQAGISTQSMDTPMPSEQKRISHSVTRPDSVIDFEALLSKELKTMRDALDDGHVASARAALKQASFYLQTIRDASDQAERNGARVKTLTSKFDGADRTLRRYEAHKRSDRAASRNLHRSGRKKFQSFAYPQKLSADSLNTRELFEDAVRTGVKDLKKGEIGKAQGKLVEARYYAKSQGYLHIKPTYDSLQRHNARTAQTALKLLAKAILRKERADGKENNFDQNLADDDSSDEKSEARRKHSLKSVIQTLYRDESKDGHRIREHQERRHRYRIRRAHHRSSDDDATSYPTEDSGSARDWRQLLHPSAHSDIFAAANGQQEEDMLRDHQAKRKEKADCNSLLCLLPTKPQMQRRGRGPSRRAMAGLGGLKSSDFAKTKTDFHTGLDLAKRLKRGGVMPKELKGTNPDAGSGAGSLSSVSMRDAEADVLRQEAKDAKKSMSEALVAYKSLLHQEVVCMPATRIYLDSRMPDLKAG